MMAKCIPLESPTLSCPESILFGLKRVFSGLVDASYCVTYFQFCRNIRGYEFTRTIDVNYHSFKCVDVTCQIDKKNLCKGFG